MGQGLQELVPSAHPHALAAAVATVAAGVAAAAALYRGKWSSASKEEVDAEMAKGTPFCYRFRVPANKEVS
jgi:hypothetical protein